jgi:hypothetical protein
MQAAEASSLIKGDAVPASRSRTERWRDCLRQVYERDGALEISIPAPRGDEAGASGFANDLIWRVRILSLSDDAIVVDQPSAAGRAVSIAPGVEIIAVLSIGQNRWMFRTKALSGGVGMAGAVRSLRLAMPTAVERCMRRNFFRASIAELSLPRVECWPLLEPSTVAAAEVANRALILDLIRSPRPVDTTEEPLILPEVGPRFTAKLMNVGGGGAGLLLSPQDVGAVDRTRLFWLRIDLTPQIPAPLGITARLVHTHVDSTQSMYAGLAFEWAFHPAHRDFVVQQITRYVELLQAPRAKAA